MKSRCFALIVLILFLVTVVFASASAAVPLAASLSPASTSNAPIQSVLLARTQAGVQLQQSAPASLIGCPVVPVTGIFANPQPGGPPQDFLLQGICVEFDQRSSDGQWIRIQEGESQVSHPGWVAAVDILLEKALDQLPAAVTAVAAESAGPSTAATTAESAPNPAGGVNACLEGVNSLNVRRGPGIAYRSIGYLLKGSCVPLTARTASAVWVKSDQGWMATRYLQVQGDLNQLPIP
jgi:uncharacterized protein YgiM (DUF1202 family)